MAVIGASAQETVVRPYSKMIQRTKRSSKQDPATWKAPENTTVT